MFIKDPIFEEFIESKKWKELRSFKSLEVVIAFVIAVITTVLCSYVFKYSPIEEINALLRTLTKDIAIALFGLMGFLITGLAILLSGISSKVMEIIKARGKEERINKIFLSFYFEGMLIGILIILLLMLYIISYLNIAINILFSTVMVFVLSYLVIFTIFYSVGLIGNCISIFRIVNNYSNEGSKKVNEGFTLSDKDKSLFNELKVMALENVLIINSRNIDEEKRLAAFIIVLEGLINETIEDELKKKKLLMYFNKIYKNK